MLLSTEAGGQGASPVTGTQPSLVVLQTSMCGVKLQLAPVPQGLKEDFGTQTQ